MGNKSRHSNSRNVVFRIPEQRIWKNLGSRVPYVFFYECAKIFRIPCISILKEFEQISGLPCDFFFFGNCFVLFLKEFGSVHSLRFFLKNVKECWGGRFNVKESWGDFNVKESSGPLVFHSRKNLKEFWVPWCFSKNAKKSSNPHLFCSWRSLQKS